MKIEGKHINLRLVEVDDASFILKLRLERGSHLSETDPNVQNQVNWIASYKERERDKIEYYFVIEDKKSNRVGVVRLYNIDYGDKSFSFGSFIVDKDLAHRRAALDSLTVLFNFAFKDLNLDTCFFDCRVVNDTANNFYSRYGAKVIKEDELNYYYEYDRMMFSQNVDKYLKSV